MEINPDQFLRLNPEEGQVYVAWAIQYGVLRPLGRGSSRVDVRADRIRLKQGEIQMSSPIIRNEFFDTGRHTEWQAVR